MKRAQAIGRLAGLAVGVGIGAAVAAMPGIASADDMQVSIDGLDLLPTLGNSAHAESGMGDFAIAIGNDSFACAGCADSPGTFDFAFADGTGATGGADSGSGDFDNAIASGANALADSGLGNGDTAISDGLNSFADATGASPTALGNLDFADAWGANTTAQAAGGIFNVVPSSNDVALDFDPLGTLESSALAGDGNFDLAGVFGEPLDATAIGNLMVDIVPTLF